LRLLHTGKPKGLPYVSLAKIFLLNMPNIFSKVIIRNDGMVHAVIKRFVNRALFPLILVTIASFEAIYQRLSF